MSPKPIFSPVRLDKLKAEVVAEINRPIGLRHDFARAYVEALRADLLRLPR